VLVVVWNIFTHKT